ncbi:MULTISPECIES: chloride channel protein [Robiginitalea]|uniref:Putative transport related, membrane protein n=1 Tax=Robiginitalea biformata (strain ATCC BAA-864 / DSM 15991 / KCTC 12146 / HTCC2501) TaxID=313596 RepID=A4CHE2_ROBBH|nr:MULTISPECIES: chloride channel protein [Robiginitalea]EAR16350.1 putative transport related, membrane protein [Robiginitalea biformata HTCC2501]MDC6353384.1 chloride channel protein [Robiginitalea sp. PM2]MDC6373451.1 chloride channel protein [Robiginitalea sp. SP8]
MGNQPHSLLTRFLKWRYKHISHKTFTHLMSVVLGFLAGLAAVTLKNATYFIESALDRGVLFLSEEIYFILPIVGLTLVYLYVKYVHKAKLEHAISSILFALSRKKGLIQAKKIVTPLITAPLTVGFGGSVGLLGPAVASGAAISSNISRMLHISSQERSLLIACASAGAIASVFQAPIAAIIFAVEVFSLDLTMLSMLPLLLASISGVLTSYFFLGDENLFTFELQDSFAVRDSLYYILLGMGTAVASVYFTRMYFGIMKLFQPLRSPKYRLLVGGLAIGTMLYFIPPLYGEGFGFINSLLEGDHLAALGTTPFDAYTHNIWVVIGLLFGITLFKAVAMTTTFAAGGAGGIFIPTMVMGGALGNMLAKVINNLGLGLSVSESNFTLIGMAGLIAGVIHAPLTAIFLIAEITGGYDLFVPLMITAAMSFLITRNTMDHTIYTRELARIGALITHNKDQTVLTLMELDDVIETGFREVRKEMTLGEMLLESVAKSTRNIFPVVDADGKLEGIVLLDDIREFMFDTAMYDKITVASFLQNPPEKIFYESDSMKQVMKKFQDSGAWNLPVVRNGKYAGFVSKSKLLTAYRRKLITFAR